MDRLTVKSLFRLENTIAKPLLESYIYPWEIIPKIRDYIFLIGDTLDTREYEKVGECVYISHSAKIDKDARIEGACIIGHGAILRKGAYLRGNCIIGDGCIIGNSCEIKNSILFNESQVPHFNYVGDSILGYKSHIGAGGKISNLKSDKSNVTIFVSGEKIKTDLKKLGAILGDYVEIGCNSVLNPGTIIGKNTTVYPLSSVRGYVDENSIYKSENNIVKKDKS